MDTSTLDKNINPQSLGGIRYKNKAENFEKHYQILPRRKKLFTGER